MNYLLTLVLFLFPTLTFAQQEGSLQGLITGIGGFINVVLIPFILGVAFLIFVINAIRYFVIDGSSTEGHENARNLALYGIGAFVLILSLWGIVNILANGIGLNEGPCVDGQAIQSDYLYGIDSLAPCSSISSTPRPVVPPDTTAPGGDFGQDIPGSVPPGGVVGDPNPEGPGVILPGSDSAPTSPTSPPTSFTPDGNDFNYTPVATIATEVTSDSAQFLNNDLPMLVGFQNLTDVQRTLFSDIASPQTGTPEQERVLAMLRLENLNELTTGTAQNYFLAVQTYQEDANIPTDARLQNFSGLVTESTRPVPMPVSVINAMTATRNTVLTTLGTYNSQNTPEILDAELFTKSLSPNVRYTNFRQYYTEGALYDQFVKDIKTEKIFNGDNSPLP